MFTQILNEAIKRFQFHFSRGVVYARKAVTVDLELFRVKFSVKFVKDPELLILLYYKRLSYH